MYRRDNKMEKISISAEEYKNLCKDRAKLEVIRDILEYHSYPDYSLLRMILKEEKDGTHTRV